MERGRVRVNLNEDGTIVWNRGGEGLSVKEFVETYPCEALRYLTGGGLSTHLGEALLSAIGGRGKLQEFNRVHDCGEDKEVHV